MKRILFPTDFSVNTTNALHYAVMIAQRARAKLYIFHAYHEPALGVANSDMLGVPREVVQRDIEEKFKSTQQYIKHLASGEAPETKYIWRHGWARNHIPVIVEEENIDFIVMGTKGAHGIRKLIGGSNTIDTIDRVDCPVFTIPETADYNEIDTLLYAAELETGISDQIINQLVSFAHLFDTTLYFLHVENMTKDKKMILYDKPPESFRELRNRIDYPHCIYRNIEHDDVLEGLDQELDKGDIKALAMTHHQRNFWQQFFHKSKTREMVARAKLPLLALHD